MRVTGKIIKIEPPFAIVLASRPETCEHCANAGICNKKDVEIRAYNDVDAELGDFVTVETNEQKSAPLILSYLFLTPVAILLFACFLYTIFPWLSLVAIPLLVIYYVILKKINKNHPVRAHITGPAEKEKNCSDLIKRQ